MLRDRIVCGIQDEGIQRKLLSESKLTFLRTSKIDVSMEAAAKDAVVLKISAVPEKENYKLRRNGREKTRLLNRLSLQIMDVQESSVIVTAISNAILQITDMKTVFVSVVGRWW